MDTRNQDKLKGSGPTTDPTTGPTTSPASGPATGPTKGFTPSHRYFENRSCRFYPCHRGLERMNCLFCFCPLYTFPDCGGDFEILEGGVKSCSSCAFPHRPESYDLIMERLKEIKICQAPSEGPTLSGGPED